jgi:cytochrome c oxidase cbb3-type subunit 3
VQTIAHGRTAAMTPWGEVLGAEGVDAVVAYVQQLSGQQADPAMAAAGATHFQTYCMACHGVDGKGMAAVGAPNLTDGIWLYGGDEATLKETVTKGRMGQMPAFQGQLGEQRVRLLAAYALKLSGGAQ